MDFLLEPQFTTGAILIALGMIIFIATRIDVKMNKMNKMMKNRGI